MPTIFGTDSTKNLIVEIISQEWPLTAKKVHARLSKKHNVSTTYQAIHKALKELTQKRILQKGKEGYLINKEWLHSLSEFAQKTMNDIEENVREIKSLHKISFKKNADFITFYNNFLERIAKEHDVVKVTFHFRHVPYPNVLSREELEKMKRLLPKLQWVILAASNTVLDKWCAQFWEKMGVKVKTGCTIATDTMVFVVNDYVLYLYLPQKAKTLWDSIFAIKDIKDVDMNAMSETLLNANQKEILYIIQDKEVADLLHQL